MSGKSVAFRIDVILQSVNELRQEKKILGQRYADEKYRSKNLESKLEQETVKLAQQKVGQTDSQADRLNEINDAKQKVIADLNEKINQETEKQESDVAEFKAKLSELTQFFRDAKKAYAKNNLTKETKEWRENMDSVVNEAQTKNIELEDVTKAFENLSVDTNKIKELVVEKVGQKGLTYKELKAAIDQLTRKQEQLHKFLKWLESCENKAKSEIQEYDKRCLITGQERGNRLVETEIADVIVRDITVPLAQNIQAEAQRFHAGENLRNEHRDAPSHPNYSIQPNYHHVPIQNTVPITRATPVHFSEHPNTVVDHGPRHPTAPNQRTQPVTRAAPVHIPDHVDRASRVHHTGPNQNTPAVTRTTPGRIPAVNSPSFFISLPFGRTR